MKISQLAEKVEVEVKHLGRIERGEKKPSFDLIIGLADCLNVSPAKFFEFDEEAIDLKALRRQIDQLVGHDPTRLSKARRILTIFFDS